MRASSRLIAAVLVTLSAAAPAASAEYTVDRDRSELVVRLFKAGMASGLAHDHVIRASDFTGSVAWDPAQPAAATVEIRANASSLIVDEPEVRGRHELEGELSGKDRQKVQQTMESAKQLDVATYPEMAFRSTAVRDLGGGSIEVIGDLTLHGTTRSISFVTSPNLDGGPLSADAEIDFLQSDFGIKPYSAFLGSVKNQDGAKLIVHLVAASAATEEIVADEPSGAGE